MKRPTTQKLPNCLYIVEVEAYFRRMNWSKRRFIFSFLTVLPLLPAVGQSLLVNGDFGAGNSGFATDYGFVNSGQSATPGTYGLRTNSQNFNSAYASFGDHTTGTGNMLLLDGSITAGSIVWSQTVATQTNTTYTFSAWVTASDAANLGVLRISVNGIQIGANLALSTNIGQWQQFSADWNSGVQTSAAISITDTVLDGYGNDFALDDLSFASSITTNALPSTSIYLAAEIGWNSQTGKLYQLQYSTVMDSNNWLPFGVPVPGNGTNNYIFDSMRGQSKKFYRVQVLP